MSQDLETLIEQFEERVRNDIPLINHMGFQQLQYDRDSLTFSLSLEPNHNDKGTAFAGSLSASANLCGWGLITLLLESLEKDYDVVIRDSRLEYFLPVTQDFQVRAEFAEVADTDQFIDKIKQKGKARMDVVVQVIEGGELCFRLSGAYVALERKKWV
ncbi:MAG: thioesterase domain-containing protein [Motiliproteus sp.]|nr:thioesterase domain-containing protein [Motiliproteus sp.]MCW9051880.1 thioesterase domain-containing protein [Motiliproteus sp.]